MQPVRLQMSVPPPVARFGTLVYRATSISTTFTAPTDYGVRVEAISADVVVSFPASPIPNERHAIKALPGSVSSGHLVQVSGSGAPVERPGTRRGTYDTAIQLAYDGQCVIYVWNADDGQWDLEVDS